MHIDGPLYEEIIKAGSRGEHLALATVIESKGSAPAKVGAKMLVRTDGSISGTVGGGETEMRVIRLAREMLRNSAAPEIIEVELTEDKGFLCGGKMRVFIEPLSLKKRLLICGAGHVGQALSTLAKFCGFFTIMADDRPDYANGDRIPDADQIVVRDFAAAIRDSAPGPDTFLVIVTRDHQNDFAALLAALKTRARYIGVIGSKRKRSVFMQKLGEQGFGERDLARINMPVGLDIGSVTPQEIAVSIMAEIIQQGKVDESQGERPAPGGGLVATHGQEQTITAASG